MSQDTTGELAEFRRFILTAVKPASEDYCRGCHMASYPGDSLDTTCSTLAEVEEILLPELSRELGPNEDGWDWTLRGVGCDGEIELLVDESVVCFGAPDGVGSWAQRLRLRAEELQETTRRDRIAAETAKQEARDLDDARRTVRYLAEKYGRPVVEAWIEDDQEGGSR